MTDIPIFTAAGGISTLVLKEVASKKAAHIIVRGCDEENLEAHLSECAAFCRMVGAERVYAGREGEALLPHRQPAYEILELSVGKLPPSPPLLLTEVTGENVAAYIDLYNGCFGKMINAQTMTAADGERLTAGGGFLYFDHGTAAAFGELEYHGKTARLCSIGVAEGFRGGLGGQMLLSLLAAAGQAGAEEATAKVMSTNHPAGKMYEKAEFCLKQTLSVWYLI